MAGCDWLLAASRGMQAVVENSSWQQEQLTTLPDVSACVLPVYFASSVFYQEKVCRQQFCGHHGPEEEEDHRWSIWQRFLLHQKESVLVRFLPWSLGSYLGH